MAVSQGVSPEGKTDFYIFLIITRKASGLEQYLLLINYADWNNHVQTRTVMKTKKQEKRKHPRIIHARSFRNEFHNETYIAA